MIDTPSLRMPSESGLSDNRRASFVDNLVESYSFVM